MHTPVLRPIWATDHLTVKKNTYIRIIRLANFTIYSNIMLFWWYLIINIDNSFSNVDMEATDTYK